MRHNVTWCNHNMCAMMWESWTRLNVTKQQSRQIHDLDRSRQQEHWACHFSSVSWIEPAPTRISRGCNIDVIFCVIRSHSRHCQDCQVWSGCLSPKATANFLFCIYSTHFNSAICFQYAWNWRGDTLSLWLSAMQFWVFPNTGDIRRHSRSCRKKKIRLH